MSSKNGTVVLSYHDSVIHESDVELLTGPHWLNDTIIGFYLEYLEEEIYKNTNVCFVRPEVAQCLKFSSVSEFPIFLDPLKFKEKSFAVIPLNDCDSPDAAGGSHWSLLVFSKPELTFFHIDSSQGSNTLHARTLSSKISEYLNPSERCEFKPLQSLQQSNFYDCGVFVLCNVENVIKYALKFEKICGIDLTKNTQVSQKRRELKMLIEGLANQ